jgi:hypothetical protein
MTGKKLEEPNERPKVYPSKIDLGYSIFDEYSGEYWFEPGAITPKVYPSYELALLALANIKQTIMADRTQNHKPQPIIVPWIEDRELAGAEIMPAVEQLKQMKRELSESQRSCGARMIA